MIELPSLDEAKALTERYVAILGDVEVDIRGVTDVQVEPDAYPARSPAK